MKKAILPLLLLFCFFNTNAQTHSLKKFDFLLGSWELNTIDGKITEHWKSGAKTYLGASYKHTNKGDSALSETVIIQQLHGSWFYSVTGYKKNNMGTTHFRLISSKKNTLVFEDREHDFPQQIGYKLKEKDKLFAWIAGKNKGKEMKIDFEYQRKNTNK